MDQKPRKRYSGDEIPASLREHMIDGAPVSDVCEQAHINPAQFYRMACDAVRRRGQRV